MNATDEHVEAVSEAVGMYPGGWDTVDPKEIIEAAWALLEPES